MSDQIAILFAATVIVASVTLILLTVRKELKRTAERHRGDGEVDELEDRLCPHCGYDVRATPDRCPECGKDPKAVALPVSGYIGWLDMAKLHNDWPDAAIKPVAPDFIDEPVLLHSTLSGQEAELVVEQLTARGVYATLQHREQEELSGSSVRRLVYCRVIVPKSEEARALAILDRFRCVPENTAKPGGKFSTHDDACS